jgi:hypothetical protein
MAAIFLISVIILGFFSRFILTAYAAPDNFYLRDSTINGASPAGEDLSNNQGSSEDTMLFDDASDEAYWYTELTYPSGASDASIAAGAYSFYMYFDELPPASAHYRETTVASFTTTSDTFVDVTGGSLVFTPGATSEIWVILISAQLGSSSGSEINTEAQYTVNSTVQGMGGVQVLTSSSLSSWQHFYRVTNTTSQQTVQVQLRHASENTAKIEDLKIIAFKMPASADFQFEEDTSKQDVTASSWNSYESLTFTPSSQGDYLIMALANAREYPGEGGVGLRFKDASSAYWPDDTDGGSAQRGYFDNGRDTWYSFYMARVQNLTDSEKTFYIEAYGDDPDGSEIQYTRIMAFRMDAFDDDQSDEDTAETSTTSTSPVVKSTLTTTAPPASRDYIIIQSLALTAVGSSSDARQAGFEHDDVEQTSYNHVLSANDTYLSYGFFDAVTTSSAVKYENTYSTSDSGYTVYCKESAIHVLRFPAQSAPAVFITVSVHHTDSDGSDATLIVSNSTTITSATADPLEFSLGSGALQTFQSTDVQRLRIHIDVTGIASDGSFTLAYDSAANPARLSTPAMTVDDISLLFMLMVAFIPVLMALVMEKRRMVTRLVMIAISMIMVIAILGSQVLTVLAAPDYFYLRDTTTNGATPAGEDMSIFQGASEDTMVFDDASDEAYWYTETTYPTGGDDAVIPAGAYSLNMYFDQLPSAWWDTSYLYRKQITVNNGSEAVDANYTVSLTFDHDTLAPAKSLISGNDIRIGYWNGSGWVEVSRALDPLSSWDDAATKIWFPLQSGIGASGSDNNYYLYYGNSSAGSPPDDWADVYLMGDDFDDGTLTTGVDTSVTGGQTISETGGEAFIDNTGGVIADAGIIVADSAIATDREFAIRHMTRLVSGGGPTNPEVKDIGIVESASQPTYADSSVENPRRRIVIYQRVDTDSKIFYFNTSSEQIHWNGSNWVSASSYWGTLSLDTNYIHELISDGTDWFIRVSQANGTVMTTTDTVAWSSVLDNSSPFWFYWGEVYTNFYYADVKSEWVYLRDYVDPEPTTSLSVTEVDAPFVNITVSVYHTNSTGGDATEIVTSSSTKIDANVGEPYELSIGSGAEQTFTQADPRRLRVRIEVDSINGSASFTLAYDSVDNRTNLSTPIMTVTDISVLFLAVVAIIPMLMGLAMKKRRLATRLAMIALSFISIIALMGSQIIPVLAAPDNFYLRDTTNNGAAPAGEDMNDTQGSSENTRVFNDTGDDIYWYSEDTWPTGGDDASIAAGNYSFHMYFDALPATTLLVDDSDYNTTVGGSSITISSYTVSGSDRLMLVGVNINPDGNEYVTGVTWNTTEDLTKVRHDVDGNEARTEIWYLKAPTATTADVVVSFDSSLNMAAIAGVVTFTGVDQTTPLGNDNGDNWVDEQYPSVSVTTSEGDMVFGVVCMEWKNIQSTDADTEHWRVNDLGGQTTGGGGTKAGAASSTSIGWSFDDHDHTTISAVAINPAAIPSVGITVSVHHTDSDGSDPALIISNTATINANTSDPYVFSLGSGAEQTFQSTDVQRLRLLVDVTSISSGGSFTLAYDSAANPSYLATPVITVPEASFLMILVVFFIPIYINMAQRRRRAPQRWLAKSAGNPELVNRNGGSDLDR